MCVLSYVGMETGAVVGTPIASGLNACLRAEAALRLASVVALVAL
jgi:hypothetical protein